MRCFGGGGFPPFEWVWPVINGSQIGQRRRRNQERTSLLTQSKFTALTEGITYSSLWYTPLSHEWNLMQHLLTPDQPLTNQTVLSSHIHNFTLRSASTVAGPPSNPWKHTAVTRSCGFLTQLCLNTDAQDKICKRLNVYCTKQEDSIIIFLVICCCHNDHVQ